MRIAQLSDIHISTPGDRPHEVDVRTNFLEILQAILAFGPDHIVLSGDICLREPSDEIYGWVAQQLKDLNIPVSIMPGNHDAQEVMAKSLACCYHADTNEIYDVLSWEGLPVYLLDSARGVMSDNQYQWFTDHLRNNTSEEAIIFIHHPPAYCGVPHMDMSYAFREIARIQSILVSVEKTFEIFCGHYHVDRIIEFANQRIHITPSTFFQIDASHVEFKIDHKLPGFRVIDIVPEGVSSECFYL